MKSSPGSRVTSRVSGSGFAGSGQMMPEVGRLPGVTGDGTTLKFFVTEQVPLADATVTSYKPPRVSTSVADVSPDSVLPSRRHSKVVPGWLGVAVSVKGCPSQGGV